MSKRPKNLTFAQVVVDKAEEIRQKTGDPTFSALCVRLITEEHDRRVQREGWLINFMATASGMTVDELRAAIDDAITARMSQAEFELMLERKQQRKGRKGKSKAPSVE